MWLERYIIIVPTLSSAAAGGNMGTLCADMGRDLDHRGDLRRDGVLVPDVCEVVPDYFHMGVRAAYGQRGIGNVYLSGEFQNHDSIIRAISDLKAKGFNTDDLDVFSDEPLEFLQALLHRESHMSLIVVIGAITSLLLVIGFVYFTQVNYPLITGGMPLFSFWATGVVFFEMTMFGAIVTTFFWFLRESGLLRRRRRAPVPVFEAGFYCVRVQCRDEQRDAARASLQNAGAADVRALGEMA